MSSNTPLIYDETSVEKIVATIKERLWEELDWHKEWEMRTVFPPRTGEALISLFGRLAEIVIARINQIPEKHFRAFLEEAGVDLLSPRPATTDITFSPAKDAPEVIRVAPGTQVSAKQTETHPEIIFETQDDLTVVKVSLETCMVVDPVRSSDRTMIATGEGAGSFAAFQGDMERERALYLGDEELFALPDATSRENATVTLTFAFSQPGDPEEDGWQLQWLYFDGTTWQKLPEGGVEDGTAGFSTDGAVQFTQLPELLPYEIEKGKNVHLQCRLIGGNARGHLPIIKSISGKKMINIPSVTGIMADAAFSAIHAGSAFVPLQPGGEFFPLGQRPGRLDAFYIRMDEAFSKTGATVEITLDLEGVPVGKTSQELDDLRIEWAYAHAGGWQVLGVSSAAGISSAILSFADDTKALTASGEKTIRFIIPGADDPHPAFATVKVGDQEGLWLRARVTAGGYGPDSADLLQVPRIFPPFVKGLTISYEGFNVVGTDKRSQECRSSVDGFLRDHAAELNANQDITPFSSDCDFPTLYVGFGAPFPGGEWIELLVDMDEVRMGDEKLPPVFWEYGDDKGNWKPLLVSDGSEGLSRRGYIGFYGVKDQGKSTEFGQSAYWLRACPHYPPVADAGDYKDPFTTTDSEVTITLDALGSRAFGGQTISLYKWRLAPLANAGNDQQVVAKDGEATITLDASQSQAIDPQSPITRYSWRLVASNRPVANAGLDQVVVTQNDEATVELDALGSTACSGREIKQYIWRKVSTPKKGPKQALATPFLRTIRINTVSAMNSLTIQDEVVGSSTGKTGQIFPLLRPPILPDIRLYVRETDMPPAEELEHLRYELEQLDEANDLDEFPLTISAERGVWVRWLPVTDFYHSTNADRHFMLDLVNGRIRFGDGKRGKIPPVGLDNVKAARYRTNLGGAGNVPSGEIVLVRNPTGPLTAIKGVSNPETAAGGSDAETVEKVRMRGPQTLKHRDRAVTSEDFVWLARDASGEVAKAWCYPTRDVNGLTREGWVTVVIIPTGSDTRPYPTPALLRHVQRYLDARALVNLKGARSIVVRGPEYVEARVDARVVPQRMEKADEVKLAILERLNQFFHPLTGGAERQGWELGRNVFLSEVYAEIEAVPDVDHVAALSLTGSIQQQLITIALVPGVTILVPVRKGSQISTFDNRIRLLLAEHLEPPAAGEEKWNIPVYGFKSGDRVNIVDADNTVVKKGMTITSLREGGGLMFELPCGTGETFPPLSELALMSVDQRLRLPLAAWITDGATNGEIIGVTVQGFQEDDILCIASSGQHLPDLFRIVTAVEVHDSVAVPEGHLIWSGAHRIEMILEE